VRLSAIVVAYGKERILAECLASVEAALARVDGTAELVVVVNAASPITRERLAAGAALVVEGGPELGYAGAVERGLAASRGEWVALVNDDCVVRPEAFAELLAAGSGSPAIGSVAARIHFADRPGTVNSAGIDLDRLGVASERLLGRPLDGLASFPTEVWGASGTLGLYRRAMLDDVGGFDSTFFAYLEDADLAWRARMAGWRCVLAPGAIASHHHSTTLGHGSAAKHRLVGRNRVRMLAKNATARRLRLGIIPIVGYDLFYVSYVALTARTLAPLSGRLEGLAEWRRYREAGRAARREIVLPRSPGLRAALARNRVYNRAA
jgi:GT2 family glycosyltransferase